MVDAWEETAHKGRVVGCISMSLVIHRFDVANGLRSEYRYLDTRIVV